ncbi:MAG: DUF547 domain-containing protein [Saprospiraceae bacterium]|nr:DUF547 domain-containing protein [Saprospiraceae bacterium]
MNNTFSPYILFAFMLFAVACKSEAKTTNADAKPIDNKETNIEPPSTPETTEAGNQDVKPTVTKPVKEIKSPKAEKEKKPQKNTSTTSSQSERPVDKGIQIEMGMDPDHAPSSPVKEEKAPKETKETKPDKEASNDKPDRPEKIETFVGIPKHTQFDQLLRSYVNANGVVDYGGLKKKESKLDEYLSMLESHPPETTWNRNQELAYWINAYNAYTIKLILTNYPVNSITDLENGKPWDKKWINLDGKSLSLNMIENDIIRPKYKEPRIHFAVNCAAKSCPPLLNEAFKANKLDAQLEAQTKKFINNSAYNSLSTNEIKVSKIFEWYGVDFGDIATYVSQYADKTVKTNAKVTYMEYDWNLNGK